MNKNSLGAVVGRRVGFRASQYSQMDHKAKMEPKAPNLFFSYLKKWAKGDQSKNKKDDVQEKSGRPHSLGAIGPHRFIVILDLCWTFADLESPLRAGVVKSDEKQAEIYTWNVKKKR